MDYQFLKNAMFTKCYDFIMTQDLTEKAKATIKELRVSQHTVKLTLCVLTRKSEIEGSESINTTTKWIAEKTGLSSTQVEQSLKALKALKFINWETKGLKTPRAITVNFNLVYKMYEKWARSTQKEADKPTVVEENTPAPAPTQAQEPERPVVEVRKSTELSMDEKIEKLRNWMTRNKDVIKADIGDNPHFIPPRLSDALRKVWGGDYYQSYYTSILMELGLWQ